MDLAFMLKALIVLFVGFCLLRIIGKKTVGEMTGLEIITLLAMASMIGHGIDVNGLGKTLIVLCIFAALLITVQFLAIKNDFTEKWFMGKATLVIQNGQILTANLKKLRISVDQLEAKLREKGISSVMDVKTATIEMSGQIGYELTDYAKPITFRDLSYIPGQLQPAQPPPPQPPNLNLFNEVIQQQNKEGGDRTLDPQKLK